MRERLIEIIRKEFRQAFREPRMRSMLFMPPLLQLLIFGFAVNLDVDHSNIAWMDGDRTYQSRELLAGFQGSGRFDVVATPANDREVQDLLDSNKVDMVVRVLPGFERDIQRGRTTSVQILINGANSNTASIVSSYASSIVNNFASEVMTERNRDQTGGSHDADRCPPRRSATERAKPGLVQSGSEEPQLFRPRHRGEHHHVDDLDADLHGHRPRKRDRHHGAVDGHAHPADRADSRQDAALRVGRTCSTPLLVVVAALLLFHVPFRGSALLLFASGWLFLMTSLGAGLFISTISRTQQQAMMTTSMFFQPFFLLSGFAFPIRNMPRADSISDLLNPVRYFMEIVRGIFLKGSGVRCPVAADGGAGGLRRGDSILERDAIPQASGLRSTTPCRLRRAPDRR